LCGHNSERYTANPNHSTGNDMNAILNKTKLLPLSVKAVLWSAKAYWSIHLLHFRNSRFSKRMSLSLERLCVIIKPAQLNSLSTEALEGNGAFSLRNKSVSCGQANMLQVSSHTRSLYLQFVELEPREIDSYVHQFLGLLLAVWHCYLN
jgi:hypothetical protein